MNTRRAIDESAGPVALSVALNQNNSCFSVGLDTGFCIFNADPCQLTKSQDFNAGIAIAEMLGRSNFIALVGGGKQPKFPQNKVIIWDDIKHQAVLNLEFRSQVHSVRLSRTPESRIIVALQNSLHIYKFSVPPQKLSVFETADNPQGLCCLGPKIVAFPGRTPGQVQIVEISTGNVSIIPAHSSSLQALTLSSDGEILATASSKGTIIRVFSTRNCARICELRRGVDQAIIFSLVISPSNSLLAVTSDKSTLHIFDLPTPYNSQQTTKQNGSPAGRPATPNSFESDHSQTNPKWGILSKVPLLPRVFSDIYSFTSSSFSMDDEDPQASLGHSLAVAPPIPGIPGGKARKGIVGWKDDWTLIVLGAGRDGRWEKYVLGDRGEGGSRVLVRGGWKRYLGG